MRSRFRRLLPLASLIVLAVLAAVLVRRATQQRTGSLSPYEVQIQEWRDRRAERLQAENGWLTVAGLFWLKEGENTFGADSSNAIVLPATAPPLVGTFVQTGDEVRVRVLPGVSLTSGSEPVTERILTSDADGEPTVLALDNLRLFLIERSKGYAIRMRDLDAPARRDFAGLDYFPIDPRWRIEARAIAYDEPRLLPIANVTGTVDTMLALEFVEFKHGERAFRLQPIGDTSESDELFFIFKDRTSGRDTYPAGRFLVAPRTPDGQVILDFNKAYNPPCAYTDFATCPLPPPENELPLPVTAGERIYRGH